MGERENIVTSEIKSTELKRQLYTQILLQQIKYLENVQGILLKAMQENEFDYSARIMEMNKLIFSMVKEI